MQLIFLLLLLLPLLSKTVTSGENINTTNLASGSNSEMDALNNITSKLDMQLTKSFDNGSCKDSSFLNLIGCNCSYENGTLCHVTSIYFYSKQLSGIIPAEIANLTYLEILDLSSNELYGQIPDFLSNLSHLKYINLSQNYFDGSIPSSLGALPSLESLDLNDNSLNGSIPSSLGALPSLRILDLTYNSLDGSIPSSLGALPSLESLDLSENYLNGSIPSSLGALPSLQYLEMWANDLDGEVPMELGNISTLAYLSLSENRLSGKLPNTLGNLKNLETLYISQNEFTGTLPETFAKLQNLKIFDAIGNNFSGPIPEVISGWNNIKDLELIGNDFTRPFPKFGFKNLTKLWIADIPFNESDVHFPDISSMKSLKYLILRNCSIRDRIPDYIGTMTSLEYLDLSFNDLSGEVPKSLSKLPLKTIYLTGNKLNGSIPSWSTNSTPINADFSNNNFTKVSLTYRNSSSNNTNLFMCCSPTATVLSPWQRSTFSCDKKTENDYLFINCGGPSMTINGSTYEADLQTYGESTYYVSPKENWAYSSTGDFIDSPSVDYLQSKSGTNLDGAPLYTTARISPLSLKYYALCLVNGNYTVNLHFAEIVFTDVEDYSIKGSRVFDVFIQGKIVLKDFNITREAGGPKRAIIKTFTISVKDHRPLEIHFYWAGKGSIYIPPKRYGPLISAISITRVPKGSGLSAISIAGIAGSAFLLVLALGVLWKMGWLGGKKSTDEDLRGLDLKTASFTLRQIKAATNNFDVANKIGEGGFGSVYKGLLSDGTIIAVKQLSSKSKQGNREFVNEIGMISALQHPHLVKLYGCCMEGNQLLLVYEYMENNSLARALFGPKEYQMNLDWPTRHKICVGIARGLAYLHEESRLKIVHRDIKASNILLDKDLNPKISDFGLAKLDEEENTHISTRIAGTFGYMAPEYAMRGYLTDKADVYSFGIVALEIISGRSNANCKPKEDGVYLLDWALLLKEKGNLMELVDPKLESKYIEEEVMGVINIALQCTNVSSILRPAMSIVVSMLEDENSSREVVSDSNISEDLKFKAVRDQYPGSPDRSINESQTQVMLGAGPWTGSSTSVPDLYPIHLNSQYWNDRE